MCKENDDNDDDLSGLVYIRLSDISLWPYTVTSNIFMYAKFEFIPSVMDSIFTEIVSFHM